MAGLTLASLAALYVESGPDRWGIILALLPFFLIIQHAVFLRIVRRPILVPLAKTSDQPRSGSVPNPNVDSDGDWWRAVLESAKRTTERYFSPGSLAIRYGTAAVAVLIVDLVAFLVLFAESRTSGIEAPATHAASSAPREHMCTCCYTWGVETSRTT